MMRYEIDYYFEGEREHISAESTFPFEDNYDKGLYTQEDLDKNAYTIVEKKLKMEHRKGYIDPCKIHANIEKI